MMVSKSYSRPTKLINPETVYFGFNNYCKCNWVNPYNIEESVTRDLFFHDITFFVMIERNFDDILYKPITIIIMCSHFEVIMYTHESLLYKALGDTPLHASRAKPYGLFLLPPPNHHLRYT